MQNFLKVISIFIIFNTLHSAEDSSASEQIVVSKLLVRDIVNSAVLCGQSAPVSLLTYFPIDCVHEALPEDPEKRKEVLTRLMCNSAMNRNLVTTANALGQVDQMFVDLCSRITFDAWDRIELGALDANPLLCVKAVEVFAQKWPKERFNRFALGCIQETEVYHPVSSYKKSYVRRSELLKACLLKSQDPSLCMLPGDNHSGVPLFEFCLNKLFEVGNVSGQEFEALCMKPSDEDFNRLLSGLKSSHEFKCAVLQGILRHKLTERCATFHPRAVQIHQIIEEMDTRINGWVKRIKRARPLSKAFAGTRTQWRDRSILDEVYDYIFCHVVRLGRPQSQLFAQLNLEMLRAGYVHREISKNGGIHINCDLLIRMLMNMYYCSACPIMPNEPLCPENPADERTLFFAALTSKEHLPHEDLFKLCGDMPEDVFADIAGKLQRSDEFKAWSEKNIRELTSRIHGYQSRAPHRLLYSHTQYEHDRLCNEHTSLCNEYRCHCEKVKGMKRLMAIMNRQAVAAQSSDVATEVGQS